MPHSQSTTSQQTVCKFHLDPQYHIFHWGSTILGNSTLCNELSYFSTLLLANSPKFLSFGEVVNSWMVCSWWSISSELSWWRHQMETFSALLALCAGNSLVTGKFPTQRPVARRFDVFFDLRMKTRLSKQSRGWWFETLSRPFWCPCNVYYKLDDAPISSVWSRYLISNMKYVTWWGMPFTSAKIGYH